MSIPSKKFIKAHFPPNLPNKLAIKKEKRPKINILSLFSTHIYPPTYTNSLKDIASYIGFDWVDPKASGIQSVVWRKKWELINNF